MIEDKITGLWFTTILFVKESCGITAKTYPWNRICLS